MPFRWHPSRIASAARTHSRSSRRQLQPREIVTVKLPNLPQRPGDSDSFSAGVRIEYDGKPGAVVAQGWMLEKNQGFSLPFAFHTPSNCNCSDGTQHLYGAGVSIGANAMMGMTPGAVFSPYLAVRNRSNGEVKGVPVFSYHSPQGAQKVELPSFNLSAQANTLINLKTYQDQGLIPSNVGDGNIDLRYRGDPGALVAELASVDQYGSFVSPVPLVCNGNRALQMSCWRTDGDWHSMLTLQNIAKEANDVEIGISYPGGVYVLNRKIAAEATVMISINELQQAQRPDANGRRIPPDSRTGGVNVWSRNLNAGLVMNAMLMNPTTKTCGQCNGTGYVTSYYLAESDAPNTATSFRTHMVGDSFDFFIYIHWSTGGISQDHPTFQNTSNAGVADYIGYISCNGPGTATITVESGQNYPRDPACASYVRLTPQSTVTVIPLLSVDEVGFKNDFKITKWSDGSVIDDPDGASPTWKSSGNPDYPAAYQINTNPTAFAKLGLTSYYSGSTQVSLQIKNGSTVIASKDNVTISGSSVVVNDISFSQSLSDSVKQTSTTFTWEVSFDSGGHWRGIGSSGPHALYWTYFAPYANPFDNRFGTQYTPLYDLALQKACGYADGASLIGDIIDRINIGVDTDVYYDPNTTLGNVHPLVYYGYGVCLCADNAALLRGLLRSIGMEANTLYFWGGSGQTRYYYKLATGALTGSFWIIRPAHENATANPHFTYHAIVSAGGEAV